MSTTVTYKGATLTTVSNQTRTLETAGKYMEGDVIIEDVTAEYDDGNSMEYGITDTTLPLAGIAVVSLAVLVETSPQTGTAKVGYTVIGG